MKIALLVAGLLFANSSAFACIGDPESISLGKLEAAMAALKRDPVFRLYLGRAGEIKNISIRGDIVSIRLETYLGEKSVRVYETKYVGGPGNCDAYTTEEIK